MYYEYWGLKKPPFDNVPDPSMYVESHVSVENTIGETLFAAEEGEECIAVIVGDVGLGKTMSIRVIIDSLDHDKYKIALVTNPDMSFIQLLREIIGQLIGEQCGARKKQDLLEIFNKILFDTVDEGKRVIIFIDEANAMSPANLESLRLLTNMQEDNRNLFTIVLAGQLELARRLEHPKRANLFQRVGIYNRLDKIASEELVRDYVETRLKLAGGTKKIFVDDAFRFIWEYSENGVPRLVNKLCKLSLKAGETNNFKEVSKEVIQQIGERFQRLSGPTIQKRAVRKKISTKKKKVLKNKKQPVLKKAEEKKTEFVPEEPVDELPAAPAESAPAPVESAPAPAPAESIPAPAESAPAPVESIPAPAESAPVSEKQKSGKLKIKVKIPPHIIKQAKSFSKGYRNKLAGILAAQALQKHSQIKASLTDDPLSIWNRTKELILAQLEKKIASTEEE